ncbi:MAG: hypothetical protein JWM44_3023 [Bacilli bacterium]|nr:hypothetical protein [Bacilli bacterium]
MEEWKMKWKKRLVLIGGSLCVLLFFVTVAFASNENPQKGIAQRVSDLEVFFADLKSKFTSQQHDIVSLNQKVEGQTTVVAEFKRQLTEQQGLFADLKTQLNELQIKVDQLVQNPNPSANKHRVSGIMVDANGKSFFSGLELVSLSGMHYHLMENGIDNGTFAFYDIPDGTYNIRFYYDSYPIDSLNQIVVAGSDLSGLTIKLAVPTFTVSGQAKHSNGSPMSNQMVTLKAQGNIGGYWPTTKGDGTFVLNGIAPGTYTLQIGDPNVPVATVEVTVSDHDVLSVVAVG